MKLKLITLFLALTICVSFTSAYIIDGDSVYWENSFAKLTVTPHTSFSRSGLYTQKFNVENKLSQSGDLCVAYVFDAPLVGGEVVLEQVSSTYSNKNKSFNYNKSYLDVSHLFEPISYEGRYAYYSTQSLNFEPFENHTWIIRYEPEELIGKWDLVAWNTLTGNCGQSFNNGDYRNFLLTLDPWYNLSDASNLNDGALLYYKLDGDVTSETGFYDGTATNGASSDTTTGKIGTSYVFDSANDYLDTNLQLSSLGTSDFSINLWANSTVSSGYHGIGGNTANTDQGFWWRSGANGEGVFIAFANSGGIVKPSASISNGSTNDGTWHMYTLIYDNSAGQMTIYFDGGNSATTPGSETLSLSGVSNLLIGNIGTSYNPYSWGGQIDEVSVFNYTINQSEIYFLYNDKSPGTDQQYVFQIESTPPTDTCTYSGSGNHVYQCSDNCQIGLTDFATNDVLINGTGTFTGGLNITNYTNVRIQGGCDVI